MLLVRLTSCYGSRESCEGLFVVQIAVYEASFCFDLQVGGATALIGDPTGKRADRPLLAEETVASNARSIAESVERLFSSNAIPEHLTREASAVAAPSSTKVDIHPAIVVNNLDFYRDMSVVAFMRDVGRFARMSSMLSKESVQSRLGGGSAAAAAVDGSSGGAAEHGLSFTEFSYQLFQAYDYWRLSEEAGCVLQVGGSDQWGNITAGIDLVRRRRAHAQSVRQAAKAQPAAKTGSSHTSQPSADARLDADADADVDVGTDAPVHGLTVPLLTSADGAKWGKSAGNVPVWLDERRTSHHAMYQYLLGTSDEDAPSLLRRLTLLPDEVVDRTLAEHAAAPHAKLAQRALADGVTEVVRGASAVQVARRCASILFAGSAAWASGDAGAAASAGSGSGAGAAHSPPPQLQAGDLLSLAASGDLPVVWLTQEDMVAAIGAAASESKQQPPASHSQTQLSVGLPELLVRGGLSPSRNEARRTITAGGLQVNGVRWAAAAAASAAAVPVGRVGATHDGAGLAGSAADAGSSKSEAATSGKGKSGASKPASNTPQVPMHLDRAVHFIEGSVCLLALGARKRLIVVLPGPAADAARANRAPDAATA